MDLLIIGGGNMGGAIAAACLDAGGVTIVDPDPKAAAWTRFDGRATVVATLAQGLSHAGPALRAQGACVLLAVKPQVFPTVAPELALGVAGLNPLVVSIMAGVTTPTLERAIPGARVVRAMPNLGAAIGRSMTAMCAGASAGPADVDAAAAVLARCGAVERIDEPLMDAFTALAGSGPAFLFFLAEAMARGGVAAGFDGEQSRRIVAHTLDAAARLLIGSEPRLDAPAWRARVTSRKGTTQAAMDALDAEGVMEAVARAVVAGRDRGRALGRDGV